VQARQGAHLGELAPCNF